MFKFLWQLFRSARPQTNIFDKKSPTERHIFDRFQWNGGRLLSKKEQENYHRSVNGREAVAEVSE